MVWYNINKITFYLALGGRSLSFDLSWLAWCLLRSLSRDLDLRLCDRLLLCLLGDLLRDRPISILIIFKSMIGQSMCMTVVIKTTFSKQTTIQCNLEPAKTLAVQKCQQLANLKSTTTTNTLKLQHYTDQ